MLGVINEALKELLQTQRKTLTAEERIALFKKEKADDIKNLKKKNEKFN